MNNIDLELLSIEQREELYSEANASRVSRQEELFGPSLDANQIDDYTNFRDEKVLDQNGKIIGFKSELPRKRYK